MQNSVTVGIRIDIAYTVALFLEMFIYGVYFCLFFAALPTMAQKRRLTKLSPGRTSAWVFLVTSILMFFVATAHLVVAAYRVFRGIVIRQDPLGAIHYIHDHSQWGYLADIILLCVMTWMGDSLVIYRCYIIWNHDYRIVVFPVALLWCSIIISSIVMFSINHPTTFPVATTFRAYQCIFVLAFAENMIATSLIVLKIYLQHRQLKAAGGTYTASSSLIRVVRIVVESAMIYTIQLLILIIFFFLSNNIQFILLWAVVPSIGITFVLIALRVHAANQPKRFDISTELEDNTSAWPEDDSHSEMEFSQPENTVQLPARTDDASIRSGSTSIEHVVKEKRPLPLKIQNIYIPA